MKKLLKRLAYLFLVLFIALNILCAFQAYHLTRFSDPDTNPKPQQMGFLERTGALLLGETYPKTKVVDSLSVPHTTITLRAEDGFRLAGWESRHPQSDSARGTILMFHGHGSNRSALVREATMLYNLGWDLVMIDFRAHGQSQGNECTVGYYEAKDVKASYDYAVAQNNKPVVLWGISMGAATITKALHDYASIQPKKVILEMPFGSMLDAVRGRLRIMQLPQEPMASLLTFWGGTELGIWAFANKPEEYARAIQCPVLLAWGELDPRVSREETLAVYDNLASAQKQLVTYPGVGHESLCKKAPGQWLKSVSAFLQ